MDEKQWYYIFNNQQQGPVDEGTIQQLVQNHIVNANTLVWQQGMAGWVPLQSTPLQALVPVTPAPPVAPPSTPYVAAPYAAAPYAAAPYPAAPYSYARSQMPVAAVNVQSLKQLFMTWWILLAASVPLMFVYRIGILPLIAAGVIVFILLYRYWQVIQDGNVRTTPGKAVGYCFIPFFNFYWIFTAFHGLSQDMNRYCREHNILAPVVNEQLALWYCILIACSVIPYLDILTIIAGLVILIILLNQFTKTSEAIINSRTSH